MKKAIVFFMAGLSATASVAMGGWDGYAPVAEAQITVKVVDDAGVLVSNALVSSSFFNRRDPGPGTRMECCTDTNGYAVLAGKTSGELAYWISKDGYYETSGGYKKWMEEWRPPSSNIENKQWQPWNPTIDVVLKEIKNPTPMYVKGVEALIPILDKPVGFDLEKSDWVSPHGKGVRSDFLIRFSRERRENNDFDLYITVDLPNEGDGIQEIHVDNPKASELRMPHEAPLKGYRTSWTSHAGQRPESGYFGTISSDETKNYFYRIRTVLDENGDIKETYYGKIHGAFYLRSSLRENPKIIFRYYLNPTPNDRNVEFDPEQNLFGGRDRFAP